MKFAQIFAATAVIVNATTLNIEGASTLVDDLELSAKPGSRELFDKFDKVHV